MACVVELVEVEVPDSGHAVCTSRVSETEAWRRIKEMQRVGLPLQAKNTHLRSENNVTSKSSIFRAVTLFVAAGRGDKVRTYRAQSARVGGSINTP